MPDYVFTTQLDKPIEQAIEQLKAALMNNHLGIVSEVNVAAIIKTKLKEQIPAYRILGACNPKLAKDMIEKVPEVGALLPCTIVAREENGKTIFNFMNPKTVLALAKNPLVDEMADDAMQRLKKTIDELG